MSDSKLFTCTFISLNPHNNSMREVILLSPFYSLHRLISTPIFLYSPPYSTPTCTFHWTGRKCHPSVLGTPPITHFTTPQPQRPIRTREAYWCQKMGGGVSDPQSPVVAANILVQGLSGLLLWGVLWYFHRTWNVLERPKIPAPRVPYPSKHHCLLLGALATSPGEAGVHNGAQMLVA